MSQTAGVGSTPLRTTSFPFRARAQSNRASSQEATVLATGCQQIDEDAAVWFIHQLRLHGWENKDLEMCPTDLLPLRFCRCPTAAHKLKKSPPFLFPSHPIPSEFEQQNSEDSLPILWTWRCRSISAMVGLVPRLRMTVIRSLAAILPLRFLSYNEKHSLNSANGRIRQTGNVFRCAHNTCARFTRPLPL